MCDHRYTVRVWETALAIGRDGALCGEERQDYYGIKPVRYEMVEFCGNPACEKVFKAVRP